MQKRLIIFIVLITFLASTLMPYGRSYAAETVITLPSPGSMVSLSSAYEPVLIKGLTIHKDNPFLFDFVVDTGNSQLTSTDSKLKTEADRLIKYFFACLTIPEKDLWVNLSPYEKDRMTPEALGKTALGRDLLAEDYVLKQISASLIYPEKGLGKEFWNRVYTKAQQMYGSSDAPMNTFNKIWILADKATVYEHGQTVFVVNGHLKVMLEEDYQALNKHIQNIDQKSTHTLSSQIIRDIVIPEIEKEVNTGKNFAPLRQIFNSLILATWYKKNLKEALLNQVYADKSTVLGVHLEDASAKEEIYQQYLKAYKKGVFNFIKEDLQSDGKKIPRKYFSGGFGANVQLEESHDLAVAQGIHVSAAAMKVSVLADTTNASAAMKIAQSEAFDLIQEAFRTGEISTDPLNSNRQAQAELRTKGIRYERTDERLDSLPNQQVLWIYNIDRKTAGHQLMSLNTLRGHVAPVVDRISFTSRTRGYQTEVVVYTKTASRAMSQEMEVSPSAAMAAKKKGSNNLKKDRTMVGQKKKGPVLYDWHEWTGKDEELWQQSWDKWAFSYVKGKKSAAMKSSGVLQKNEDSLVLHSEDLQRPFLIYLHGRFFKVQMNNTGVRPLYIYYQSSEGMWAYADQVKADGVYHEVKEDSLNDVGEYYGFEIKYDHEKGIYIKNPDDRPLDYSVEFLAIESPAMNAAVREIDQKLTIVQKMREGLQMRPLAFQPSRTDRLRIFQESIMTSPDGKVTNSRHLIVAELLRNAPFVSFSGANLSSGKEALWREIADKDKNNAIQYLTALEADLQHQKAAATAAMSTVDIGAQLNGKLVLIVDNDPHYLDTLEQNLTRYGARVVRASNGKEALKILSTNNEIKAVISDFYMPKMNGEELIKEIRKKSFLSTLKIILWSTAWIPPKADALRSTYGVEFMEKDSPDGADKVGAVLEQLAKEFAASRAMTTLETFRIIQFIDQLMRSTVESRQDGNLYWYVARAEGEQLYTEEQEEIIEQIRREFSMEHTDTPYVFKVIDKQVFEGGRLQKEIFKRLKNIREEKYLVAKMIPAPQLKQGDKVVLLYFDTNGRNPQVAIGHYQSSQVNGPIRQISLIQKDSDEETFVLTREQTPFFLPDDTEAEEVFYEAVNQIFNEKRVSEDNLAKGWTFKVKPISHVPSDIARYLESDDFYAPVFVHSLLAQWSVQDINKAAVIRTLEKAPRASLSQVTITKGSQEAVFLVVEGALYPIVFKLKEDSSEAMISTESLRQWMIDHPGTSLVAPGLVTLGVGIALREYLRRFHNFDLPLNSKFVWVPITVAAPAAVIFINRWLQNKTIKEFKKAARKYYKSAKVISSGDEQNRAENTMKREAVRIIHLRSKVGMTIGDIKKELEGFLEEIIPSIKQDTTGSQIVKEVDELVDQNYNPLANAAMEVKESNAFPGGIDLNSANMAMKVTKDANGGVKVDFDPAMIEKIKKEGSSSVVPIIINITPVTDIRPLLGLSP